MKYFLRKRDNEFWLESRSENHCTVIAEQEPDVNDLTSKISLKNCEAIELGYDLDELAKIEYPICEVWNDEEALIRELAFKKGFQKALEILGDKRFSEKDMSKAWSEGYHRKVDELNGNGLRYFDKFIQLLQQTEWEVDIITEEGKDTFGNAELTWYNPKLDENGCLILKRK
jgi:hypothetical protein